MGVVDAGGVGEVDDAGEAVLLDVGERGVALRVRLGVGGGEVLLGPEREVPVHHPRAAQHLRRRRRVRRGAPPPPTPPAASPASACAPAAAARRAAGRRSPRVVVTTISIRLAPSPPSSSPTSTTAPFPTPAASAAAASGTRLTCWFTATWDAASWWRGWTPPPPPLPARHDDDDEGAKPVKKPMTKQREKWSSAFFHRWLLRRCFGLSAAATAAVPMEAQRFTQPLPRIPDQDAPTPPMEHQIKLEEEEDGILLVLLL
ncbi:hypothetical protein OsJ_16946 [Oryza sativa Japonica Group]|uniref:Uncharacterized protein n=1 Tax=Oryza sativa subsp. japonica TaxID=39947 RepID=B9FM80_ORYSJ|nr:hypothetical protein OsJ_16946 [Oryza sativa Japonica Group]